MKTAKLGAMFLISILALAGIGMGYAAWTDTITITGSVNTGSVEWAFTGYSGTWVWKVWGDNSPDYEIYIDSTGGTAWQSQFPNCQFELIAWAYAEQGDDNHDADVVFWNLFPSINFIADVEITYTGTVPGKINSVMLTDPWPENADETLIDQYTDLYIDIYDEAGNLIADNIDPALLIGYQLHLNYKIHVVMVIHLVQLPELMGLNGDFGVSAEVVQWNEYPYIHP